MSTTSIADADATGRAALYRLLAWASPAFPTGAFSYSHGLETAVATGAIHDRATLQDWVGAIVTSGSGRIDADILCDAYRAARAGDAAGLGDANARGMAYRGSAELALESAQQGEAFAAACRAGWGVTAGLGDGLCHPVAFGAATALAGIVLEDALVAFLQAFAGNLVSAGLRLGVIGQTDGQRILAALEPEIIAAAAEAASRDPADFGGATFAADLASMAHETLYTRLFRS